ncbi:hypothetical protein BDV96DRAFT_596208 [Lophiotrema nucula]|uniref:Uncharacterized protein n=1 Tax=Lophiotrema nucula TaxID=690887 RepID=A0A6A5ZKW7_9PLEO|nr:hypothetical protein BDV96DRAFT_596208 [Lophiotrema nucula]
MEKCISGYLNALVPVANPGHAAGNASRQGTSYGRASGRSHQGQPTNDLATRLTQWRQRPRNSLHKHAVHIDKLARREDYTLCRCAQPTRHSGDCHTFKDAEWSEEGHTMLDALAKDSASKAEILRWARSSLPPKIVRDIDIEEEYLRRLLEGSPDICYSDQGEIIWHNGRPSQCGGVPVVIINSDNADMVALGDRIYAQIEAEFNGRSSHGGSSHRPRGGTMGPRGSSGGSRMGHGGFPGGSRMSRRGFPGGSRMSRGGFS